VRSFRTDARTLNRYYFVTIMGSKAGRLALSIGKAAAATCVFIPEEFESMCAIGKFGWFDCFCFQRD
jgi:6-phosphofructokinase